MSYIYTRKKRLLSSFVLTILFILIISMLSSWSLEKSIRTILTTKEGLVVVVVFLITYITLFFLSRLLLRKHQGWKRLIIVLISASGIVGGFVNYDGRGFTREDIDHILFGAFAGLIVSLVIIEGLTIIFVWVKKGFDSRDKESVPLS